MREIKAAAASAPPTPILSGPADLPSPPAWGIRPKAAPIVFGDGLLSFPEVGTEAPEVPAADEQEEEYNEEDDAELQAALQVRVGLGSPSPWVSCRVRVCLGQGMVTLGSSEGYDNSLVWPPE